MSAKDHPFRGRAGRWLAATVGSFVLLATACSGGGSNLDVAAGSSASESATSALSGEFQTLDGSTIDLASLEGDDVVFWFWAPW